MSFDAVAIEYAFANLVGAGIGARGGSHDADTFRGGNPPSLANAIEDAADALQQRYSAFTFEAVDSQPGGAKIRIESGIQRLRNIAQTMRKSKTTEPEDYHWEIVGALVQMIAAMLEKAK